MSAKDPLITIITPTYNRAEFILQAVESVMGQTGRRRTSRLRGHVRFAAPKASHSLCDTDHHMLMLMDVAAYWPQE